MSAETRWWWVRHAPILGPADRIYGQCDVACDLSDEDAVAGLAAVLPADAVRITSPLKRARQTLAALSAASAILTEPQVEPAFAEQSFGAWQGLSWREMEARDPDGYRALWADPTRLAPPGGESFLDLIRRTGHAIEALNRRFAGRDIVAVAHGGTIRAAVAAALELTPEAAMAIVVDNLSLTRLDRVHDPLLQGRGGVWRVAGINLSCRWIAAKPL